MFFRSVNEGRAMEKSAIRTQQENHLPSDAAGLVCSYLEARCTLCEAEKGVLLKDGGGEWQIWCLTCALQLLPDERPWVSPCHRARTHSNSHESGSSVRCSAMAE